MSLAAHRQSQHGIGRGPQWEEKPPPTDPQTYQVSFPKTAELAECPVKIYRGWETRRNNIWIHFVYRLVRDTIIILEEVNRPHPHFPDWFMFVPWSELNKLHPNTALCARGAERNRRRLTDEEAQAGDETYFQAYSQLLATVTSFLCLLQILMSTYNNWLEVVYNLGKSRQIWARLLRILEREGEVARTSGRFYLAVMQEILIFGLDMWVVTPHIVRDLGGFQHRVVRQIMGKQPCAETMGAGSNPHWRKRCGKQAWRLWNTTSPGDRLRCHSSSQLGLS